MTYYFAVIEHEEYAENPRDDWEQMGTLYTWHSRYTLGSKDDFNHQRPIQNLPIWVFDQFNELANSPKLKGYHSYDDEIYFEDEELTVDQFAHFKTVVDQWIHENLCILPVYMYDHSGITIRTGPFNCPWDSDQVGIIYVTKKTCEKQQIKFEDAEIILKGEINTLDQYLTGDVWGYTIYSTEDEEFANQIVTHEDDLPDDRNHEDSCGGFFGYEYCKDVAKDLLTLYSTQT